MRENFNLSDVRPTHVVLANREEAASALRKADFAV